MLKKLLILSLIVIPFYEIILYFLMPEREFPLFPDMRVTKDFMAMGFSMVIGSVVLCKYGFKKLENVWIPIFLTFLVWNMAKAPGRVIFGGVNIAGLWDYKSSYQLMVYFFLFLGISNLPELQIKDIFKTMAYCGLAMAILMGLQRLGMDQIFKVLPTELSGGANLREMGGTVGQATLSAPFIVMCLPFMLYSRKWLYAAFMVFVVMFSGSSFAMAGLCAVIFIEVIMRAKCKWYYLSAGFLLIFLGIVTYMYFNQDFLVGNGRFAMWKMVINDFFDGRIEYTGAGIGAFKYLFALKHKNTWYHAHNEYLQLLWSCGIIGFGIVIMVAQNYLIKILDNLTSETKAILSSCFGIAVVSCGTFPLQLAVYQYYLIVMAGFIYLQTGGNHGTDLREN